MGKITQLKEKFKKRRNAHARTNVPTKVDTSEQKQIKVELKTGSTQYDDCNALVLPTKKRLTKKIHAKTPIKILSKKHLKRIRKIKETREKKEQHGEVLKQLEALHASEKKLPPLVSLQEIQTLGRKKYDEKDYDPKNILSAKATKGDSKQLCRNALSSVIKKRKREDAIRDDNRKKKKVKDPRVVRVDDSSSSEDSSDDEKEEEENDTEKSSSLPNESIVVSEETAAPDKPEPVCVTPAPVRTDVANTDFKKIEIITDTDKLPSMFIKVKRPAAIEEVRRRLPIMTEEQRVMEAIKGNMVTVIVGPTGSGKTTQVPQFLYESGFASKGQIIGVTEPRRVAAISMAERVGKELGLGSQEVSYIIRYEGNTSANTKIKFMTDGILLKELQTDKWLSKYSVIIIDEAHERSLYSDVMIGILSRAVPLRHKRGNPLKLVIMSATLRVEDFTDNPRLSKMLPAPPPVIKVEGRMFDVTIHYNKKTEEDYVKAAYNKVCKIHRTLPDGGILVFLTGQQEVNLLCSKLQQTFPRSKASLNEDDAFQSAFNKKATIRKEMRKKLKNQSKQEEEKTDDLTKKLLDIDVNQFVAAAAPLPDNEVGADEMEEEDGDDGDRDDGVVLMSSKTEQPLYVLPLFSLLPPEQQKLVFGTPPPGTRLCVVATNVAETSLTIPGIKYVVDSGKTKEKVYDNVTGVSMFMVANCSQASADQRAGRAGRVSAGHCYRLYSSAVYNDFAKFSKPEVLSRPIDDICLILKTMGAPVVNFPFPTPPEHVQLRQSLKRLTLLGALREKNKATGVTQIEKAKAYDNKPIEMDTTVITPLGLTMSCFPVAPRYARMLALSDQFGLWPYTIALVAALTVPEVLIEIPLDHRGDELGDRRNELRKIRLSWSGKGQFRLLGDLMVLLSAVLEAEATGNSLEFCQQFGLRHKGLKNIHKLRRQLTNEVNLLVPHVNVEMPQNLKRPSLVQCEALRQLILGGSVDRVARRVDVAHLKTPEEKVKWKNAYRTVSMEQPVYLPSSSVLKIERPQWVVYQDIFENHDTGKVVMRGVSVIEPEWLARFAPSMCRFSEPLRSPAPYYCPQRDSVMCFINFTFGHADWEISNSLVPHPRFRDVYGLFAYHLLRGDVVPQLASFSELLQDIKFLARPETLRFEKQRNAMTGALMRCNVASRREICSKWKKDPTYLLEEYCLWLQEQSDRIKIEKIWPTLSTN